VEREIEDPPASPLEDVLQGGSLGSRELADRLRNLLHRRDARPEVPRDSQLRGRDVSSIWLAVAPHYGVAQGALGQRSRHTEMRSVAAWLAKRRSPATLRELAPLLGLGRAQGVGNLTRRVDEALGKSKELRRTIETIESRLAGAHVAYPRQKKEKIDLTPVSDTGACSQPPLFLTATTEPARWGDD
jgi:hypothetical protein